MSNKRNKAPKRRTFESNVSVNVDMFTALYQSMLMSEAYKDLSNRAKNLYTYCRLQEHAMSSSERSKVKTETSIDLTDRRYFTMNKSKLKLYGLYSPNSLSPFYADIASLIRHGFLICVYNGKHDRKKSVYAYSSNWLYWHSAADDFPTTPTDTQRKV